VTDPSARPIQWRRTPSGEWPYEAELDGWRWKVRVGDFPAEPLYSLYIDDVKVLDLDEWPPAWTRPRPR
jgi:hypothetical protein